MRLLLASTGLGALAAFIAAPAAAETVISTATTTPVSTSTTGDLRIATTGSIKPTAGSAVTIDSSNSVKNEGTLAITGANGSAGILANTNLTGNITNSGTITLDENYTATDSDNDGDLDGPFAQGSNRFGIHVLGGGTFTGNILNSGTITVEGNQSAGIALDSALAGSLTHSGKISLTGNQGVGIRTGAVSGNVVIGSGSSTTAQGQGSVGVLLGGDIGGALVIQGTVSSTGYRSATAPADTSKLDSDDLLQGGPAVVVAGDVVGGVLLDTRPADGSATDTDEDDDGIADSSETTATVTSFGSAPAMLVGSASEAIHLGKVAGSDFGIFIKGNVTGQGVYKGVGATGLAIGGTGQTVSVDGGLALTGTIAASANGASATALRIGAGASVPTIAVAGTVNASGGGASTDSATAILIDSGATVNTIINSGTTVATRTGEAGSAAAIVDRSGSVALIHNVGQIGVVDAEDLGDLATAIDLRASTTGAVVRQVAPVSGRPAPLIAGNVLLGSGNDTLDIQAGSVIGKVDFGGGSDVLALSGNGLLRGTLAGTAGLAVNVGSGATLDVQNLGAVNLASLTTGANANLGVTIGAAGHTLYSVAGAADFGAGTKVLVTLDSVGTAAGSYTIIDAGTLTGAGNLSSAIVTLPFLFNSSLSADAATGEVELDITLKGDGELQLNRSESAILDAALAAADEDRPVSAVFLNVKDAATLKQTLQQLMPEHAGGAFETATKGSRLSAQILAAPRALDGLWAQQVAWGSTKSIGDTATYDLSSWGATGGYGLPLGQFGSVGLTAGYYFGRDKRLSNELISNHYEAGAFWRGAFGPVRGWARATAATLDFEGSRNFTGAAAGGTVARSTEGEWSGKLYSASAGLAYEARMGRFTARPNASVEHYKLSEKGYREEGGGEAFDLTVGSRDSSETAALAGLALGYDVFGFGPEETWARIEVEGGRREILSGRIGQTTAAFGDGTPFTLEAEERTSGWRGALRLLGGGSTAAVALEANAEEQQGHTSVGARIGFNLNL